MPLVFGYCRASTSKQVMSTETQMRSIKAWFDYQQGLGAEMEWGDFMLDKATTSRIPFVERTYGALLSARLKPGDTVVCAKMDRMFRNAREALNVVGDLRDRGIRVVMLDMNLDTTTPIGKVIFGVMAVFAEWERDRISERTREAMATLKAKGKPNGKAPHGWKISTRNKAKRYSPSYSDMAYGFAIVALRDVHGVPAERIFLASHIVNRPDSNWPRALAWEKSARAGFVRNGKDPLRIPEVKAKVMLETEELVALFLKELARRNNGKVPVKKNHRPRLPCFSMTSP